MSSYNESFESLYQGEFSSLSPNYGPFSAKTMGYRMDASRLGFPGSPQTANQIGETVNALKQGVKAFEVTMLDDKTAQSIPIQHFKEMRALMKLTGVKPSLHGPLIDPSGFDEKGSFGGEYLRQDNERRMFDTIEKAHELNPNGNIPIVFHSSVAVPGPEYVVGSKDEDRFKVDLNYAIDQETGKAIPLKRELRYRPRSPGTLDSGGVEFTPEGQLSSANSSEWENKILELATLNKQVDELVAPAKTVLAEYKNAVVTPDEKFVDINTGKELRPLRRASSPGELDEETYYDKLRQADIFLENVQLNFNTAFHKAYKYGSSEQKEKLKNLAENYSNQIKQVEKGEGVLLWSPIHKKKVLDDAINNLKDITSERFVEKEGNMVEDERFGAPKLYKDLGSFAKEKAVETFGNLASMSYDKYGKNSPVIAVENLYEGMAFSRAEDLKELVEKSREKFVDYLVSNKKMDKKEAQKVAEKHLGVTWDVGHLNMIKKKGFSDEDVLNETKKIAPLIKHVHLSDNFGYSDSHLAPGMGNVPFKKILEELEKTGRLKEMNKIVEAGSMVQHFKKSPHNWTLSAFGSPLYSAKMSPYWNQAEEVMGSYFGGYGTTNPEQHHSLYGSGFTSMPVELGGQVANQTRSRFGGAPLA